MLLFGDLAGNKNSQMPDIFVHQSDDHLSRAFISSVEPYTSATQLNACWGGVILSPKDANRIMGDFICLKIENPADLVFNLTGPQLVADEQILNNPLDFLLVHQINTRPTIVQTPGIGAVQCRYWQTDYNICPRMYWPD